MKVLDHASIAKSMKNTKTYATLDDGFGGGKVRIVKSSLLPIGKTTNMTNQKIPSGENQGSEGRINQKNIVSKVSNKKGSFFMNKQPSKSNIVVSERKLNEDTNSERKESRIDTR